MALTIGSGVDFSSLFGTSSSNSSGSGSSNILADYASIRNGSYAKLTKAYYKKQKSDGTDTAEAKKETASAEEKIAAKASKLKSAVSALTDNKSLFEKKTVKDKDGNETTDYDWDAIGEKLQNFVDSYNEAFAGASNSSVKSSYNAGLNMATASASNVKMLSAVGISIGEDGKLSLDKDALKESNINDLKSLFSGTGSYADGIGSRATTIVNSSTNMVNSIYNSSGGRSSQGASAALDTIV